MRDLNKKLGDNFNINLINSLSDSLYDSLTSRLEIDLYFPGDDITCSIHDKMLKQTSNEGL